MIKELTKSAVTSMSLPTASFAGQISAHASTVAIVIQSVLYAMYLPGHMRRPNPNPTLSESRMSGLSLPFLRNRPGSNMSGSGYTLPSWRMDLTSHDEIRLPIQQLMLDNADELTKC